MFYALAGINRALDMKGRKSTWGSLDDPGIVIFLYFFNSYHRHRLNDLPNTRINSWNSRLIYAIQQDTLKTCYLYLKRGAVFRSSELWGIWLFLTL